MSSSSAVTSAMIAARLNIHVASFRVLEKNGFKKIGKTDILLNWKIEI